MSITPNKRIRLKEAQILEIEYTIVGICGNCGKVFGVKNTLDELSEEQIKKTWATCSHCDIINVVEGLEY